MQTHELDLIARNDIFLMKSFIGVYARDQIPDIDRHRDVSFIVNKDNSDQPGSHWIAVYYMMNGPIYLYCSFGLSPRDYGLKLGHTRREIHNSDQHQPYVSHDCGFYALYMLLNISRGNTWKQVMSGFHKTGLERNEFLIENYFENYNGLHC